MKSLLHSLLALALVSSIQAQDKKTSDTKAAADKPAASTVADPALKDKVSCFIGTQIGHDFQRNGIELNLDVFVQAKKDATENKEPKFSDADMKTAMEQFQAQL